MPCCADISFQSTPSQEHLIIVTELLRDNLYEFSKFNRRRLGQHGTSEKWRCSPLWRSDVGLYIPLSISLSLSLYLYLYICVYIYIYIYIHMYWHIRRYGIVILCYGIVYYIVSYYVTLYYRCLDTLWVAGSFHNIRQAERRLKPYVSHEAMLWQQTDTCMTRCT